MPQQRIIPVLDEEFKGNENFHLSFQFDKKTESWEFLGYRCMKCGTTLKHVHRTKTHLNGCRSNKQKRYNLDPDPELVVDIEGKPWKPFTDTNQ